MLVKILKYSLALVISLTLLIACFVSFSQLMFDPNTLPINYGKVDAKLYSKDGRKQPLLVYFGGSEGGNSMAKEHNNSEREIYTENGFAMLAIGYFGLEGIPEELDRISLDAIYNEIKRTQNNPNIDESCVAVMGGSKGAELALSLASKYSDIQGAVSFAGSHASFNSTSVAAAGRTASFYHNDQPLPFITIPTTGIPYMLMGDFRTAHELALEQVDNPQEAFIEVEKINGPILLISGEKDHVWPSAEMSSEIIKRLERNNFNYPYRHTIVPNGNHFQPQSDYHHQAVEFLNEYFLPICSQNRTGLSS